MVAVYKESTGLFSMNCPIFMAYPRYCRKNVLHLEGRDYLFYRIVPNNKKTVSCQHVLCILGGRNRAVSENRIFQKPHLVSAIQVLKLIIHAWKVNNTFFIQILIDWNTSTQNKQGVIVCIWSYGPSSLRLKT